MKLKTIRIAAFLSSLAVSFPALSDASTAGHPDFWQRGWEWGGGHMLFGGIFMAIFWVGLIFLIFFAPRWIRNDRQEQQLGRDVKAPLEILAERFAHGEIDQQEYEDRKRTLTD